MKYKRMILLSAALALATGCTEIPAVPVESSVPEPVTETENTSAAPVTETTVTETEPETTETATEERYPALLNSPADIALSDVDGDGYEYTFTYNDTVYHANYIPDKWQVTDSYQIRNFSDIEKICQALSDEHPIHTADYTDYRTADDMAREWKQHNLAYDVLPSDSEWKESARNVDLDPQDENKSAYRMFKDRFIGEY